MTLLGATCMDTERMIPSHNGSPGSGCSTSALSVTENQSFGSLARKKKTERLLPLPPYSNYNSYEGGVANMAYSRDPNTSLLSKPLKAKGSIRLDSKSKESSGQHEVIEVQILPQDENWGETGKSLSSEPFADEYDEENEMEPWRSRSRNVRVDEPSKNSKVLCFPKNPTLPTTYVLFHLLWILSIGSPILMVILPQLSVLHYKDHQLLCSLDCEGLLVSLAFKVIALSSGYWVLCRKTPRFSLPRFSILSSLLAFLQILTLVSYWLFYGVSLSQDARRTSSYTALLSYANHCVDSLLFLQLLSYLLIEYRHSLSHFSLKVLRSPDGESKIYSIGFYSVQETAAFVLDKYYTDFGIYNPYLDGVESGRGGGVKIRKGTKVYDMKSEGDGNSTVVSVASHKKTFSSHNERFHEEFEYEKKLRKRRSRLITAAEEAFTHIRRQREKLGGDKTEMGSREAAQAIFPTISRPLQKYLRVTRQQPRHTMDSILSHLSRCLSYDMSPRSFLEKYLVTEPVLQDERENKETQSWSLISESLLYRDIVHGTVFQLRQGDISLLCQISNLPHLTISEEIIDPFSNKFVLRLNSETSV